MKIIVFVITLITVISSKAETVPIARSSRILFADKAIKTCVHTIIKENELLDDEMINNRIHVNCRKELIALKDVIKLNAQEATELVIVSKRWAKKRIAKRALKEKENNRFIDEVIEAL